MKSRGSAKERRVRAAAMCTGKKSFPSPEAAMRVARQIRRRSDQRIVAYRCGICRKWHLGHNELRRGKLKRLPDDDQR